MSRNQYDDLERAAVLDEDDEAVLTVKRRKRKTAKAPEEKARVGRLPGLFVRVPIEWLKPRSPRRCPFTAKQRLLLLLLYKSYWGQRGVKLTSAVAAEIDMPPRTKQWCLLQLEQQGWVRIERTGHGVPVVWPIVLS